MEFNVCKVARFRTGCFWFGCSFLVLKQINLRMFFLKLNLLKELVFHKQEEHYMRIAKLNKNPWPKPQFLNPPPCGI